MIVHLTDVGSSGVNLDLPPHDLNESPLAWSGATNMTFRAGLADRVQGYAAGFDTTPTQAPLGMIGAIQADGTAYIVTGGTNKLFCYSGTSENELTGGTAVAATADTKWKFTELTGFIIANESTVIPHYIAVQDLSTAGATNFADFSVWPASTTCKTISAFKYFLVAGNMTESSTAYPYKVRWSNSAVPGAMPTSWTASTTNDAGSVDLSGNYGKIVDLLPFGDQLAIYRERGITMMRYVGGTDAANRLVMAFNDVQSGAITGMLGLNCGADVAGIGHVVLSQTDAYVFDGAMTRSILNNRMKDYLRENIDSTNAKRAFVLHHADKYEVWVCFPETGATACTKAIIWNYADNALGIRDVPTATCGTHVVVSEGGGTVWSGISGDWASRTETWDSFVDVGKFRKTVIGSAATKLYVVGNATDNAGTAMTSQLERTYLALGDQQRVKLVRNVWPRFEATAGQAFDISVGMSMSVDEAISYQSSQTYTYGTSRKVDVNKAGRFMALKIRTTGGPWRLRSVDVDVVPQGLW